MLGVVPPRTAWAETPSSEAEVESRRERAKLEFKRGSELFGAGQYQKAVTAFMAADRLAPSAALSFNIALAYEKLTDTSGALRWYRDYLRRSPRAPNAPTVQARINELSSKLSHSGLQPVVFVAPSSIQRPISAICPLLRRGFGRGGMISSGSFSVIFS
jgi:tetratricopeptide (TPR) repeat protein